jgi:hypothetical protein
MTRTGASAQPAAGLDVPALVGGFLGPVVVGVGGFAAFSAFQARLERARGASEKAKRLEACGSRARGCLLLRQASRALPRAPRALRVCDWLLASEPA